MIDWWHGFLGTLVCQMCVTATYVTGQWLTIPNWNVAMTMMTFHHAWFAFSVTLVLKMNFCKLGFAIIWLVTPGQTPGTQYMKASFSP